MSKKKGVQIKDQILTERIMDSALFFFFEGATFPVKDRRMSNCEDSCVLDTARRKCAMCTDMSE